MKKPLVKLLFFLTKLITIMQESPLIKRMNDEFNVGTHIRIASYKNRVVNKYIYLSRYSDSQKYSYT